jgi:hypothetical protein
MCKTVMASRHVPFVYGEWNIHPLAYFYRMNIREAFFIGLQWNNTQLWLLALSCL